MSAPPRVSLTRLLVAGSRCEACAEAGLISAQFNGQTRYYCREHVHLALRPLRIDQKRIA
jgi:hypothetical protein